MRLPRLTLSSTVCAASLLWTAAPVNAQPAAPEPLPKVFLEVGLAYGYEMSNSTFIETNNGTRLASPRNSGPAIDVAGGYAFVPGLSIFADLQHASASTIDGQRMNGDKQQFSDAYTSFSVGLRTAVILGPGEVYGQMSLGMVLPFEAEQDSQSANGDSRVTTVGYNSGLGARGELGYHYNLNRHMYLAGGLRLQAFASDNVGKDRRRTDKPSGNVDVRTYTTDPNGNNTLPAEALSVQDMRLRIGFGYRF